MDTAKIIIENRITDKSNMVRPSFLITEGMRDELKSIFKEYDYLKSNDIINTILLLGIEAIKGDN